MDTSCGSTSPPGSPATSQRAFVSGTGGIFSLYILETGLLGRIDPAQMQGIFGLVGGLDRTHPSLVPVTFLVQPGDHQTPDFTGEALSAGAPRGTLEYCHARGDDDPHYCIWREEKGWDALSAWLGD